jgi:hypothetical protein
MKRKQETARDEFEKASNMFNGNFKMKYDAREDAATQEAAEGFRSADSYHLHWQQSPVVSLLSQAEEGASLSPSPSPARPPRA